MRDDLSSPAYNIKTVHAIFNWYRTHSASTDFNCIVVLLYVSGFKLQPRAEAKALQQNLAAEHLQHQQSTIIFWRIRFRFHRN